jgi:hypothetical protein
MMQDKAWMPMGQEISMGKIGGSDGTRTRNTQIDSLVL